MKMSAVAAVVLLLLCCFSSSDSEDCNQRAAVGDTVNIKLNRKWSKSENLKWWKGDVNILYWKNKFIIQKKCDINADGSLKLTNVTKADEAIYKPEIFQTDGMSVRGLQSTHLCVLDRVGKPKVTFTCKDPKKEKVEFTCIAAEKNATVKFEWRQNNKVVEKEKTSGQKYVVTKAENEAVACQVSNEVSFMVSDSVTHNCYQSGGIAIPEKVFGIDIWIIVGGGAGIVVLLIILVIICCLRARRTQRMRLKDEEELRLDFARSEQQHPQYNHPADRHHQHQHQHQHQHRHHHHQQQPAGHTGPRQHRSKQHRNQPLPKTPDQTNGAPQPSPRRSAQAPKPANDEQPPPLPQPRKKTPRKV